MKRIFYFILFIMFIRIDVITAFDNKQKVYDYAQVLTPKQEEKLKKQINNFIDDNNMDMVFVTVKHHTEKSTEEYANEFYKYNKFGINNNGVIFVIDFTFDEKKFIVVPFGEAKKIYLNFTIDEVLKEKIEDDYYKILDLFIDKSIYYVNNKNLIYSINLIGYINVIVISFIISSIFTFVIFLMAKKNKGKDNKISTVFNKDIKIIKHNEKFLTTNTTKKRIGIK